MKGLLIELEELLAHLREFNKQETMTRSRELSLAITKLEEARFWLMDAVKVAEEAIPF